MKDENATSAAEENTMSDNRKGDDQVEKFTFIVAMPNKNGTKTLYYKVESDTLTKNNSPLPMDHEDVNDWCQKLVDCNAQMGHMPYPPDRRIEQTFAGTFLVNLQSFAPRTDPKKTDPKTNK
ncbi:hypothetical protein [Sorangium sp. So ce1099]|uniref:hypothetical protein n=1 Tax=Sorangium sp. So ce1099 TaxID=3133331 RepID=UPI003F62A6E6